MQWSTIEQLIRIVGYAAGAYFLGDGVANGEMFQAALGGLVAVGSFAWWLIFEQTRPK